MEQSEHDAMEAVASYERAPDEPYPSEPPEWHRWEQEFQQARLFLMDAQQALMGPEIDPEDALRNAHEAIARIERLIAGNDAP